MKDPVELAMSIAYEAHDGQEYAPGLSYYEGHLVPVDNVITLLGYGALYRATGILHDVIEDTDMTHEELVARGVPFTVVSAVDILSKKHGQSRLDYLGGIATSDLAIVGKYADSLVNLANTTYQQPVVPVKKFRSRARKYSENIQFLFPLLPPVEQPERLAS